MNRSVLPLHDDFDNRSNLTAYLGSQLYHGRLALILGAGIPKPFGLPEWDDLISSLFDSVGEPVPSGKTATQAAEYFRLQHFKNAPEGFKSAVHKALYKSANADFNSMRANGTLAAFGALVMSSRRGNTSDVINFNFDNLLELYLEYHGFVTDSVTTDVHWTQAADVNIFHPHGFLPVDPHETKSDEIILDQRSFSKVVGRDSNLWRQVAMTIFRRRTCLFVGLSGEDPNLDSMLIEAQENHASKLENTCYWGVKFSASDDDVERQLWQNRGVYFQQVKDYKDDLPSFIFEICQNASAMAKTP